MKIPQASGGYERRKMSLSVENQISILIYIPTPARGLFAFDLGAHSVVTRGLA